MSRCRICAVGYGAIHQITYNEFEIVKNVFDSSIKTLS